MTEFFHTIIEKGHRYTLFWAGEKIVVPSRVYALAFISADEMLLVSAESLEPGRYVPGGGIEPGETPEEALRRELMEEADATIINLAVIGSQGAKDPQGELTYQRYYWCRVTLAEQYFPRAETTRRHRVSPADYLDELTWGRSDPKAPMLLAKALAIEAAYEDRI